MRSTPTDEALARLPETIARSCNAVPVRLLDDGVLEIVVGDPTPEVRTALGEAVDGPIELLVASPTDVRRLLDSSYRVLGEVDRFVTAFEATEAEARRRRRSRLGAGRPTTRPSCRSSTACSPRRCATGPRDVHIEPQDDTIRVRFRIDGALHDALDAARQPWRRRWSAASRSWPS